MKTPKNRKNKSEVFGMLGKEKWYTSLNSKNHLCEFHPTLLPLILKMANGSEFLSSLFLSSFLPLFLFFQNLLSLSLSSSILFHEKYDTSLST
jgi:hypothetical protein